MTGDSTEALLRATRAHDLDKHRRLAVRSNILNARVLASLHELADVEDELNKIEQRYPALNLKHRAPLHLLKEYADEQLQPHTDLD